MDDKINHICPKCNFYISSRIQKHVDSCDGSGPRRKKSKIEHICPKCNLYIISSIRKHINSCSGKGPRRKIKRGSRGGWNKGINYVDKFGESWYKNYTDKISKSIKYSYERGDRKPTDEESRRLKIQKRMKEVGGGYREKSGRGKKGRYMGYWCDSSWELAWVIYNLDHGLSFERNKDTFDYIYEGQNLKYLPDFKVGEKYIEIKGYVTNQFLAKVEYFQGDLLVIDKHGIKPYLNYAVNKYGKDFIKLYDK